MVSMFTPVSRDNSPIVRPSARAAVIAFIKKSLAPVVATGCRPVGMTINNEETGPRSSRGHVLIAAGGLLGALAASSCCVLPLVLFSLGVSGAWMGNFTQLAPYQPYFLAATLAFLGYGYWLVYRSSQAACAEGEACAKPLPNRFVKIGLIV